MDLLERFKQYIKKENLFHRGDRLLLAVSGGVDSVVLCELCRQAGYDFEMAHCNFQLRAEDSKRDESFVRELAIKYGVPFHIKSFDTTGLAKASKKSVEEMARYLRYQWFKELIESNKHNTAPGDTEGKQASTENVKHPARYIVTAHHADDNIETVVMNFFRGTGITGLRGISPKQDKLVRPLLFARRRELEEFLQHNHLLFVTDHTNFENEYTRNFFRNKVIPLVNESYTNATENVLKNIRRFRDVAVLYQQSVEQHKKKLLKKKEGEVHIPILQLLKTNPLKTIVYEIIKEFGFTAHQTGEVVSLLQSESSSYITSPTHRIVKDRRWLIISPVQVIAATHIIIEEKDKMLMFANGELLIKKYVNKDYKIQTGNTMAQMNYGSIKFPLILRKWKQGDYFYPLGMQKKKKLSRFFIDQKLSLIQKENTWVIEMDKKIIWVVGMRIDDRFKITDITKEIFSITYLPK